MFRRSFLKFLGQGMIVSSGMMIYPSFAMAGNAFDNALKGQNLIQRKRFAEAVEALKKAVSIDSSSDWAYGLLGRAHLGLNQKAEALAAFREAVRLNEEDIYSRMMIEIISQKPVPILKKKQAPLSALEKEALREEAMISNKLSAKKGLDYQVKRVVIDAGHGGFDPGAVSKNGLKEKDITLNIALNLNEKLKQSGKIKSFLTRTGDYYVPLSARTVAANQFQADLFISIHINAHDNAKAHGSETYFCSEKASSSEAKKVAALENSVLRFDEPYKKKQNYLDIEAMLHKFEQRLYWSESGKFAKAFQERFKRRLPFRSRGVHSANFYVLRRAKMPSILLETGFISNPDNEAMLKQPDFIEKISDAIARGLV